MAPFSQILEPPQNPGRFNGFKDQYVSTWDAFINSHSQTPVYGLPDTPKRVASFKFYRSHFIGMKNFTRHTSESLSDATGTNRAQACIYASYIKGEADSWAVVTAAEQQLVAPGQ